jgi:hypothetical protein
VSGVSAGLVKQLLKEMAGLFPDEVMHIGTRTPTKLPCLFWVQRRRPACAKPSFEFFTWKRKLKTCIVLSAGGDETGSSPPCTLADTKSWEVKMIEYVQGTLGKQVMGWEEVLFKTNAASNDSGVIVDSWARSSWQQAATLDHRTVVRGNARSFSSGLFCTFVPSPSWQIIAVRKLIAAVLWFVL